MKLEFTAEQVDTVRRLTAQGWGDTAIGRELGMPPRRVRTLRDRYGILAGQAHTGDGEARPSRQLPPDEVERLRRQINFVPGMLDDPDDEPARRAEAVAS